MARPLIIFALLLALTAQADVESGATKTDGTPSENVAEASKGRLAFHIDKIDFADLPRVLKTRYLRVLTTKNPYDYFIRNGDMKGVQYEMVREFVDHLNQKYTKKGELKIAFEMIPVDFDELVPMLTSGRGDIIAVGMSKTKDRKSKIEFTRPYQYVSRVVVTRNELANEKWEGKTFHVQKDSSYLWALTKKGVKVKEVDANLNAENLMELVSLKGADYTLVNSYWAEQLGKRFANLTIIKDDTFKKKVKISWAVRKQSKQLLKELNAFLPKVMKGTLLGNTFNERYFEDLGRLQCPDFDLTSQKISKYDESIKKYAQQYGFDWRLLAALALQESRFEQDIENKFGAIGLFQIKQITADEPYISIGPIKGADNFDNNIHAGTKYLAWLKKTLFDSKSTPEEEKVRMMLAAYNAGPGKVRRAIARAKKAKLNPNVWFRNVELAMLQMGISEPVIYVSEINKHYVSYVLLGIK